VFTSVIFSFAEWAFSPVVLFDGTRIDTRAALAVVHSPAIPIGEADAVSNVSAHGAEGDGLLSLCHLPAMLRFYDLGLHYLGFDGST
jgi:hypothetical protein